MASRIDSLLTITSMAVAGLRVVVTWMIVAFFAYMGLAVLIQVVGRYVFNYSIDWAAETATIAQIIQI